MYMSVVVCFILFFSALYCRLPAVDFASEVERAFLAFGMFQNYTCLPGKHDFKTLKKRKIMFHHL